MINPPIRNYNVYRKLENATPDNLDLEPYFDAIDQRVKFRFVEKDNLPKLSDTNKSDIEKISKSNVMAKTTAVGLFGSFAIILGWMSYTFHNMITIANYWTIFTALGAGASTVIASSYLLDLKDIKQARNNILNTVKTSGKDIVEAREVLSNQDLITLVQEIVKQPKDELGEIYNKLKPSFKSLVDEQLEQEEASKVRSLSK